MQTIIYVVTLKVHFKNLFSNNTKDHNFRINFRKRNRYFGKGVHLLIQHHLDLFIIVKFSNYYEGVADAFWVAFCVKYLLKDRNLPVLIEEN